MNPKHVTNPELSKQLFEAGITKDFESEFVWFLFRGGDKEELITFDRSREISKSFKRYPALLLSELLELMPTKIEDNGDIYDLEMWYASHLEGAFLAQYYRVKDADLNREIYADGWDDEPVKALSSLASYLLRDGKFNDNAK